MNNSVLAGATLGSGSAWLLIGAVLAVGVLHTMVPDHWVPISLLARQRSWSKGETARAALQAGTGHVMTTLLLAFIMWLAGVAVAAKFGNLIDRLSGLALIAFGSWIGIASWLEMRGATKGHGHSHDLSYLDGDGEHATGIHGPELQRIDSVGGPFELSIYESHQPPHFRFTVPQSDLVGAVNVETKREGGVRQKFAFTSKGDYWESVDQIPEPHGFDVTVMVQYDGQTNTFETTFAEHDHEAHHDHAGQHTHAPKKDYLYSPLRMREAVASTHVHQHRHSEGGQPHEHRHDHTASTTHAVTSDGGDPLQHQHRHKTTARTALLLILGSSPMVEGIPAFFAAGKYGPSVIIVMALVFAASTIATYVLLCVYSTAGLQRVKLGVFERYGEVLSGAFISLIGLAFLVWPLM